MNLNRRAKLSGAKDLITHALPLHPLLEQKAFSVGTRIEHPQELINKAQYGDMWNNPLLGAADYKLSNHPLHGRGGYTFCMCPGGTVVAASSEEGGMVTNGMSEYARDGENAKGSCRSVEGFSIYDAIEAVSDCLDHFGGHTLAAGLGLRSSKIPEFRRRINEYAADKEMPFALQKIDCRGKFI